ncbi:hypothetical protein SAMN05192558_11470 [Actinokineospora alba]|uniref:Uncharacterized protein n=1 Tax=Actinokineospora alba TaxID=504798 RepID=A0A1H0VK01_9PSEU|nr:hypothetical protein [Actinokineospora alba]TDP67692.1 hypothetical protein C8E96_3239 [Actinokineospora alba]SDJ28274.1 hypothetical protein SAMN05421871_11270 [Actinokineospora alba]SDP78396.1 hypothetical protein SAMN05192558_11470 [Actinokineospora alba]
MNTTPMRIIGDGRAPTDVASLDDRQRARDTCVRCGRVPLTPAVVTLAGMELVACADEHARVCTPDLFWRSGPCPSWCSRYHSDNDHPDDRSHLSQWQGKVSLILAEGQKYYEGVPYQPDCVSLWLLQGEREREARIWCGKGETNKGVYLTPAEALELAATLTQAAAIARGEDIGERILAA